MRGDLLAFSGDDSFSIRAIPHKERIAKRTKKRYNKEVKKQLTMSLISDELGQASTKKSSVKGQPVVLRLQGAHRRGCGQRTGSHGGNDSRYPILKSVRKRIQGSIKSMVTRISSISGR